MKKNGTGKRLLLFILIAALVLTMQGTLVLAETLKPEDESETPVVVQPESGIETPEVQLESENETAAGQSAIETLEADVPVAYASEALTGAILEQCKVQGMNPEGAIVNLFDYWQDGGSDPEKEVAHDYFENEENELNPVTTYNSGISKGHLLRFAYRDTGSCKYCLNPYLSDYGAWNQYKQDGPYTGIVKNKLGADGFPQLNFGTDAEFGRYADPGNENYLAKETESLAYLFSDNNVSAQYKEVHENVQGLFQLDSEGYYIYNSTKNFASYNKNTNSFVLYNSPGVAKVNDEDDDDSAEFCGQFFPFNEVTSVFDSYTTDSNGNYRLIYTDKANKGGNDAPIYDAQNYSYKRCYAPAMNHYLGMTLEVPFLQPESGRLPNGKPMTFEFSGDDDVWIFIDDVLVADLGGLHDAYYLSIDFSTGTIKEGPVDQIGIPGSTTEVASLKQSFVNANSYNTNGFTGNIFTDNTAHTLKMFYLERGHMASNLYLKFNIQTAYYHQIKKVDQNGNAVGNVGFELYAAEECTKDAEDSILCTISTIKTSGTEYYVKQKGTEPLRTYYTGANGVVDFQNESIFSNSGTRYFILRETKPPDGYRSPPVDIVLEYNAGNSVFCVANRWQSGAYASFTSHVNGWAGTAITYGEYTYNSSTGFSITAGPVSVSPDSKKNGLVLAVPMLQSQTNSSVWSPVYGSNIDGFHTINVEGPDKNSMVKAILEAALNQCRYDENWYLEWSDDKQGLEGSLTGLPGSADRYRLNNTTGDMQMVYIIIEPEALSAAGINVNSSTGRYQDLKRYVASKGIDAAVNAIYGTGNSDQPNNQNVNLLDTSQFSRVFRSLIYIPNEQRELRVLKVDEDGKPLKGAQFGIFKSEEDAKRNVNAVAKGTTGQDGTLIFSPQAGSGAGYAKIVWANAADQTYYLKEISAPQGYAVNETVIPIVIGIYSIYADAGTEDDDISVRAGVGHLFQTMTKYASDGDVNITLRDITAIAQTQDSGEFTLDGWDDVIDVTDEIDGTQQKALHYYPDREPGMDYGLHDEDKETEIIPFFETEAGFLRTRIIQNTEKLNEESPDGNYDILDESIDLTGLFSLINIVVVKDQTSQNTGGNPGTPYSENEDPGADGETDRDTEEPSAVKMMLDIIGTPQTGDDSLIWWWALLCIISLIGIGATVCNLVFVKKKQEIEPPESKQKKCPPKKRQKKSPSNK